MFCTTPKHVTLLGVPAVTDNWLRVLQLTCFDVFLPPSHGVCSTIFGSSHIPT